jgi:hypothetical protein
MLWYTQKFEIRDYRVTVAFLYQSQLVFYFGYTVLKKV